ncbi:MAG: response regulator [Candidatus Brocadiia bacterium]
MTLEQMQLPSKVLLADDDPVLCRSLALDLSAAGYLVRIAANGQAAFDTLFADRIDIVVADDLLPRIDGRKLLARIRGIPLLRAVPVILSGHESGLPALRAAAEAGADDYLAKPYANDILLIKMKSILDRSRRMDLLAEASIVGRFSPRSFAEVIQLLDITKKSGLLKILSGSSYTQIWLRNGSIVAARDESEEGLQAIYNLVKNPTGRYEFVEGNISEQNNINRTQMFVLLEFSRKLDAYHASRKVNLARDFAQARERLDSLAAAEAEKHVPHVVPACREWIASGETALAADEIEDAEKLILKLDESFEWATAELSRLKGAERRSVRIVKQSPEQSISPSQDATPEATQAASQSTGVPSSQTETVHAKADSTLAPPKPAQRRVSTTGVLRKRAAHGPRLVQRFPPDIVEMMQAELGRDIIPLLTGTGTSDVTRALASPQLIRNVNLSFAGLTLGEAYYSRASVPAAVVLSSSERLAQFFAALRLEGRGTTPSEIPARIPPGATLVRVPAAVDTAFYLIGLPFDTLDSLEAENILDHCFGALLVVPDKEDLLEVTIDALSLALVKCQRHRVFIVNPDPALPTKVTSFFMRYSLRQECAFHGFDFSPLHSREVMARLLNSFSTAGRRS